jgi:hypothetical protein
VGDKFYAICEKYDTPYLIMGDILSKNQESGNSLSDPHVLEKLIRDTYAKRLESLKSRIFRAAIYSTVSIFITKVLTLVLLEALIEQAFGGGIHAIVFASDIIIPTFLMMAIVSSAKRPSQKNLNIVIMETMKIAYKRNETDVYQISARKKKSFAMRIILSFSYVLSAFMTFGTIILVLTYFGFPPTSIIIDIIFIALILFTGTAVSKRSQELTMEEEKEGFLSFLADIFFLPIQGVGRWISIKWKKYNAAATFFNALIDTPFSAFVEFLEKWRYFIKERKEEIR